MTFLGGEKLPPKLQQLLEILPDVDRVSLLAISQQYRMDLDDPGFLPLLLTTRGITALEEARKALAVECEASIDLAIRRSSASIVEAGNSQAERLASETNRAAAFIDEYAADSEKSIKEALDAWSGDTLNKAIENVLLKNSEEAITTAKGIADTATVEFANTVNNAVVAARQAAIDLKAAAADANDAVSFIPYLVLAVALLIGMVLGAGGLYLLRPTPIDTTEITKEIIKSCRKN